MCSESVLKYWFRFKEAKHVWVCPNDKPLVEEQSWIRTTEHVCVQATPVFLDVRWIVLKNHKNKPSCPYSTCSTTRWPGWMRTFMGIPFVICWIHASFGISTNRYAVRLSFSMQVVQLTECTALCLRGGQVQPEGQLMGKQFFWIVW